MIEIRNVQKTEEVTSEELENLSKVVLLLEENNIEFDLMPPKNNNILDKKIDFEIKFEDEFIDGLKE